MSCSRIPDVLPKLPRQEGRRRYKNIHGSGAENRNQYISEELQKGKTEEEVLQMLGDPWILAKTIIAASDGTDEEIVYESGHKSYYSEPEQEDSYVRQNVHVFGIDKWWKKLLLILFIVMIVVLVVAIVSGIVSFLAPVLIPLLIVMIIIRLIGRLRS